MRQHAAGRRPAPLGKSAGEAPPSLMTRLAARVAPPAGSAACAPAARAVMARVRIGGDRRARGSERDRPRRRRGSACEASQRAPPAAPAAEGAPRLLALGDDRHRGARSTATARAAVRTRASRRRARWHGCARGRPAAPRLLPPWQRCGGGEGDRPKARRTHACSLPYSRRRHARQCVPARPGGGLGGVYADL